MTGSFLVDGDRVTIAFEYEVDLTKGQLVINDAANLLWDRGMGDHGDEETPIVFADLTNQEKLDIVDTYVRRTILGLAKTYSHEEAEEAAREQAEDDAETDYEL